MDIAGRAQRTSHGVKGGGGLYHKHAQMCVSKIEGNGSFFGKVGLKFLASLYMGESFLDILYE